MPYLGILFLTAHILVLGSLAASVQYCHVETSEEAPIPFCLAVSTWENTSALATDLVMTFGYQRSSGKGWGALGLGETMVPSLMFAMYGLQSADEDLILSIRDSQEYREPRPSAGLPLGEKLGLSLNSSQWLEASFACYGCGNWAAKHRRSPVQPWIWAFSESQEFINATVESELYFHSYTGSFMLDMTESKGVEGVPGLPAIPIIDPSIPNQNLTSKVDIYSTVVPLHGGLLAFAMMILYPCGVIIMQGLPNQVRYYLILQILALLGCASGATAMIYGILVTNWVDLFKESHALVGAILLILLAPQLFLSYAYYKSLNTIYKSKAVENIHIWLGHVITFGGCLNTIFGLKSAGASTQTLLAALGVAVFDLIMIAFSHRILRDKGKGLVHRNHDDEDAVPLLEDGLELK